MSRPPTADIAQTKILNAQKLDRVGMSNVECPVIINIQGSLPQLTAGLADAFVSLDQEQKGIHMSRLFILLSETLARESICPQVVQKIATSFLKSHDGISLSAHVKVSFNLLLKRPSLLSENSGWRSYPVVLWATATKNNCQLGVELLIKYSSTCPCSAALARELIQAKFKNHFPDNSIIDYSDVVQWLGRDDAIAGTPHGQRSEGRIRLLLANAPEDLNFVEVLINQLEHAITTPVQAAVKREDEQEFARLNAANLMFAEDAVRRLSHTVRDNPMFLGTACEVAHLESLHPHDAVAKVATGELAGHAWL